MQNLWTALAEHHAAVKDRSILSLFSGEDRAEAFTTMADGLRLDWAKTNIDATARQMLVEAAAKRFNVAASTIRTESGVVIAGDKRATYGELADAAGQLPVPDPKSITFKEASSLSFSIAPDIEATMSMASSGWSAA